MRRRSASPRETRRMMKRMGLSMDAMPDVEEVVIKTSSKEIKIEGPEVAIMEMQGQKIFQVTGGKIIEKIAETELTIPEEDVKLVSDQTGKSLEDARRALEECEGDLAKAILMLQS